MRIANTTRRARANRRSIQPLPVILDENLPFAGEAGSGGSILLLPSGTSTLLARLLDSLQSGRFRTPMVMSGGGGARYDRLNAASEGRACHVVDADGLAEAIAACETSDYLMLIRARYWPTAGHDFTAIAQSSTGFRGASHAVVVATSGPVARERLVCGPNGQVCRVHRLYDAMNWPEAASSMIVCSLVPAHVLIGEKLCDPAGLRHALAARGVLTQDLPVLAEICDLCEPAGILAFNERTLQTLLHRSPAAGYELRPQGVLMSAQCRVHPAAHVVGPVVIQPGAVVEEGTRIIGPTLIGAGTHVGKDATVVGSVLGLGVTVPPGGAIMQRVVVTGTKANLHDGAAEAQRPAGEVAFTWRTPGPDRGMGRTVAGPAGWRRVQLAVKRGIDLLSAASGLLLLSPLLILTAVLVKLTSRGPVFFAHRREGLDGKEFSCVKFRSMVADAHQKQRELYAKNQVDGPQFKIDRDPRETPLGHWLRRTNIDELPQLFNVLLGHMSLVGPRPSPFRENQICVSWRRARLSVRPGITGLWQLCRDRRSEADFHQWIFYDLAYVRNFSLWLDFRVLLYTLLTFGGRRRVRLSQLIPTERDGD